MIAVFFAFRRYFIEGIRVGRCEPR